MVVIQDPSTGLQGVIAVHSTALGPAVGGLRMRRYADLDEAIADALRLSTAMSLKNAAASLGLGGGKAVIVDAPDGNDRQERLLAFADVLESLQGQYLTAEDVGTTPADMDLIATRTAYVLGVSAARGGSGDPSPATARTVVAAIREGVRSRLGRESLDGTDITVVGIGKVGGAVARLLAAEDASLTLADAEPERAWECAAEVGGRAVTPEAARLRRCDVLAPCAMGEMIDAGLATNLRCKVVAGAANNPLVDRRAAVALHDAGILYVPDFLANCGGMISIAAEYRGGGGAFVEAGVVSAAARLRAVLDQAAASGRLPLDVALDFALAALDAG